MNRADIAHLLAMVEGITNGLALCSGSLRTVPQPRRRHRPRLQAGHPRNVLKEAAGWFIEADHRGGDLDMAAVIGALLTGQARRRAEGRAGWRIPFRPDQGHDLLDDVGKLIVPGYPAIGRMRGLAELRGVTTALASVKGLPL